jgi:hypothetical protein
VFDTPGPPGDAAGLRAANARLRELLAGRDAEIAALRARVAEAEGLVADLREQIAELAARVGQNSLLTEQGPVFPQLEGLAVALGCTVTARG